LSVGGGSKSTFGNMNRPVAVAVASMDAVNAAQASVIHERNDRRGIFPLPGVLVAGLLGTGLAPGLETFGNADVLSVIAVPSFGRNLS